MSYPYYDHEPPYGGNARYRDERSRQPRAMSPLDQRRPPMNAGYYPPHAGYPPPRGHLPIMPEYTAAGPASGRPRPSQYQQYQQYYEQPPPPPPDHTQDLYDGSAYGEPEYESDSWPLPAIPQQYIERESGSRPIKAPRRPPQRPQRPDAQPVHLDPVRTAPRPAASRQHYPQPPPHPHHGSGQWEGDGYSSPSNYYPPTSIPVPSQMPYQQAPHAQTNKRPPLGPPPSARRGPASYYPLVAPVDPIVEESERGSVRTGSNVGRNSTRSYASSNAIPIGIPDYYLGQRDSAPSAPGALRPVSGPDSTYSESVYDPPEMPPPLHVDHRREQDSSDDGMDSDRRGESPELAMATPFRQASLGRKSKPVLTTVKSSDRVRRTTSGDGLATLPNQQRGVQNSHKAPTTMAEEPEISSDPHPDGYGDARTGDVDQSGKEREIAEAAAMAGATVAVPAYAQTSHVNADTSTAKTSSSDNVFASGTGMIDASSSESEKSVKKQRSRDSLGVPVPKLRPTQPHESSPLGNTVEMDPRSSAILNGLEKGGALEPTETEALRAPNPGFSERKARRRPLKINVDVVKEAEARGSLTSLHDLIQRATRLASNLDRGKTASRLGVNWMVAEEGDEKRRSGVPGDRRSGSISDILASFPPPALGTPPGSRQGMRRSWANRAGGLGHSQLRSDSKSDEARRQRRTKCCGMPLWLFLMLILVVVLLIAAAIIVPVVLVVVPNQNDNSTTSASNKDLASCKSSLTCQNGGANILTNAGACKCLCVNGYTGSTCAIASGAGCTTTSLGSTNNATIGADIPRVISGAESNFSIPLDGQTLLDLFSDADMDCSTENALVTFSSSSKRRRGRVALDATPTLQHRDTSTPSSTVSSTSSASSTSISASKMVDFARVTVLYVFQASGALDDAASAQQELAQYLDGSSSYSATNVSLGNGFSCDLRAFSIELANGTMVGGTG